MIWKFNAHKLEKINAKDGMKINASGRVSYYAPYGKLSLEINDVEIEGIGELQVIYDKRYEELEAKGWFDQSNKKPLPRYPKNIGIVTADTGAAVHDLITTINRRWPVANIFLFPSKVQGEGASKDLANKIIQANNFDKKIDVLIVGRGGGSYEDLWQFNELETLEAIKNSAIPIISAVGHEPDITLSDYVADKRAATPTAAGELATPSIKEINQELDYKFSSLKQGISQLYKNNYQDLQNSYKKIIDKMDSKIDLNLIRMNQMSNSLEQGLTSMVKKDETRINQYITMIQMTMNNIIRSSETKLENDIKTLNLINPEKPLEKGFALIMKDGRVLEPNEQISINDKLTINRKKEVIDVSVDNISKKGEQ